MKNLTLFILLFVFSSATFAAAQKPVEFYFKKPEYARMTLSPDGTHLAALAPVGERMNVVVIELASMTARAVTGIKKQDVSWLTWASNDRILFGMDDDGNESMGIWAVDKDGSKGRTLVAPAREKIKSGSFTIRSTNILDILEDDEKYILVTNNKRRAAYPDVFRMDIYSGKMRRVVTNFGQVVGWGTDQHGKILLAVEQDGLDNRIWYRKSEKDDWVKIGDFSFGEPGFSPLGISHDNKTLYIASTLTPDGQGRDKAALYEYDLDKMAISKLLFEHPDVDISGIGLSDKQQKLVSVSYVTDKPEVHYFDPQYEEIKSSIDQALPNTINSFSSITRNEDLAVVTAWSDRQPGVYYMYDFTKKELREMASAMDWIKPAEMAEMKPVTITARDGLKLPGYLTLPPGSDGKNLPLIMNPHGGPWARDNWGYNPEIQFLASRGYAVLQVNFRGSTGYGRDFLEASYGEWGLAMQDDISDSVNWAIEQGIANKDKVCIYGGSYGGYATMAGLTYTPDLYQCGVNYVGVTSITLLFETMPAHWESARASFIEQVGDPEKDKEKLEDRSPVNHVEKIRAPLFMAYGRRDPRVVLKHAEILEDELKKHGKEYSLLVKDNEGHGFRKYENQIDYYGQLEAFFAKHLQP